jgi:hypothetical protein
MHFYFGEMQQNAKGGSPSFLDTRREAPSGQMYVDGEWVSAVAGRFLDTVNPATEQVSEAASLWPSRIRARWWFLNTLPGWWVVGGG